MADYYDRHPRVPGDLVYAGEGNFVPKPDDATGSGVPVFSENLDRIGCVAPGTPLVVIRRPQGNVRGEMRDAMFIEVLAPGFGNCWVRAGDVRSTQ